MVKRKRAEVNNVSTLIDPKPIENVLNRNTVGVEIKSPKFFPKLIIREEVKEFFSDGTIHESIRTYNPASQN